jgi:hypothetical protein
MTQAVKGGARRAFVNDVPVDVNERTAGAQILDQVALPYFFDKGLCAHDSAARR